MRLHLHQQSEERRQADSTRLRVHNRSEEINPRARLPPFSFRDRTAVRAESDIVLFDVFVYARAWVCVVLFNRVSRTV